MSPVRGNEENYYTINLDTTGVHHRVIVIGCRNEYFCSLQSKYSVLSR